MAGTCTAAKRKPVWQEVEEAEASKAGSRVRATKEKRRGRRYGVVYDTSGPKVRLGVLWFLVALGAIAVGPLAVALVYGGAAAVAAGQAARAWRKRRHRPNEQVAMVVAGGLGLGATLGSGGAGLICIAGGDHGLRRRHR